MNAQQSWSSHYISQGSKHSLYPTEWVVRTLAGGNYPKLKMDKCRYLGARILDMGCGDGRNLGLLQDLGFEVHAVEISEAMIDKLQEAAGARGQRVQFAVGRNESLPYPDGHFDYMLCCSSCYYLEGDMSWAAVRKELARALKPGGRMIANFPDEQNAVLKDAIRHADGSLLITSDPFSIRNGSRFMAVAEMQGLETLLAPEFRLVGAGHQSDDFYGLQVSGFMTVSERL
jgi:SAM-dependent methyltransferase